MGKLRGGSGIQWDICGCVVVELQAHYMTFLVGAAFSQHAVMTFQSGINSPSSSFILLCTILSICLHF